MPIDWAQLLDPVRAVENLRQEMTGDWYRDPWGWPEYEFLLDGNLDWLTTRANSNTLRRVMQIDVPKENFGIRPAVVIEPLDRVLYQSLVDAASKDLIGDLTSWVHGWRLDRSEPLPGKYSPNGYEWKQYRGALKSAAIFCECGLKSDITSCFSSIPIDRVCEDVTRKVDESNVATRLTQMLIAFDSIPGRRGLAQRSTASAVLANMYLERLRHLLNDYYEQHLVQPPWQTLGVLPVLRWMDDLWIFGNDEGQIRSLQVDLQGVARDAGLELNLGKTKMLMEESLWNAVSHVEHSAVDAAIDEKPCDLGPLEELLDQIIESPEVSDRTSIRFAMTRMRRQLVTSRLDQLVEVAPRMPHGADHLARAFRTFRLWRSHEDWFLDYIRSPWSKISWSAAQFGTMFPTKTAPSNRLQEQFANFIVARADFPLLALAVQRLAAWSPSRTRDLLHDLVRVADHPHERRIIGLAAATAGEESSFIRRVLSEYEENFLTLRTLENRGFMPVEPAPDFGSDED